jgi:hypothetical protein
MKSDFLEFIGNARRRRSDKFRNQLYIFLICLVLSIFIWALVRLSKEYYYSVEYHLNYTQVPSNLRMINNTDSTINLRIKIQGFDFFSEQFIVKQYREYDVSLRNIKLRYLDEHIRGYILTNRIGKEIVAQTSFPSDVYFVSPDTLFFEFEKQSIRKSSIRGGSDPASNHASGNRDSLSHRSDTIGAPIKQKSDYNTKK